jgi:xanthine dehydrogenase YagS FAD-binding subunit
VKPVEYLEPVNVGGVFAALTELPGAASLIAGGSDLLGELKEGTASYQRLVSLSGIDSLRGIERTGDGLRIGAMTTLTDLEYAPELTGSLQILAEAARSVATPEIRNQGTLGGNLCQRPRCLHFRNALTPCLKKGGDSCPASESPHQAYLSIMGAAGGCYAVHASDLAPPLIALEATAQIEGPAGQREVALRQFFSAEDSASENVLSPGELLTAVTIPQMPAGWRGLYSKGRERTAGDFAVVSVAVGYDLVDGRMQSCRVVLGGVGPTPLRITTAEAFLTNRAPDEQVATAAAAVALSDARPLAHNAYKVDLTTALLSRSILRLATVSRS